jgi:hypothetical protein
VVVPAFAALCWWQVRRATSGNELSWAYVFEWPLFALYAVYMWWRLVHEPPAVATDSADAPDTSSGAAHAEEDEDPELAAYNRYLSELHESGRPKRW